MKIADARAWLTARSSRVRTQSGEVVIGIPLDMAGEIAGLLPPEIPTVPPEQPVRTDPQPEVVTTTTSTERVVDTESGPVKVPEKKTQKKVAKKKAKKRAKKQRKR